MSFLQDGQPTDEIVAEFTNVYNGKPEAPKTGDYRNMWMWIALIFVSGGVVVTNVVVGRKEEKAQ